jgi:sigma-B regulation protein RsbU (phosphoserine phosphatase)
MTAVPIPPGPSPSFDVSATTGLPDGTPVFALKELVARLQREQAKIQDLLSSLGFALRSLNNLNQLLELIPMIATRVTDASGGALVLFRPDGQVRLEQLHCQNPDQCQNVRSALEAATRQVTASFQTAPEASLITMARSAMLSLDRQVNRYLGNDVQLFGTAIIIQNVERGRLYVFS